MKTNTAKLLHQTDLEYGLPVGVEDPISPSVNRAEALKKGFRFVIGNDCGPSIGIRENGALVHTSCGSYREEDGLEFLRAKAQQIVEEFGPGAVKCRGTRIPTASCPIWQPAILEWQPRYETSFCRSLVSPETPLGGGDTPTGWYEVIEMEFSSLEEMAKAVSSWGSDSEATTPETLKIAELQVAKAYAYR